jgi:DNA-binding GntR family transcriptional regulator
MNDRSVIAVTKSCAQDVVDYVREGMRDGLLTPGQRLAEPDLMKRLAVSRGTVREALAQLRAEGLVDIERYRGAQIRILPRYKVIEFNQIRAAIEGLGARLAAENLDVAGRRKLVALDLPYDDVSHEYDRYNREFHAAIIALSGNESLPSVLASTSLDTFRIQFQRLLTKPEVTRRSHKEHCEILQAILVGNGLMAERLMAAHVLESSNEILRAPRHFFSE